MLDFELFPSIQFLQNRTKAISIEDLFSSVAVAFQETNTVTMEEVSLSLQRCLQEAMQFKGDNEYLMPREDK